MYNALPAELLTALKPTPVRDSEGRVDASIEHARLM